MPIQSPIMLPPTTAHTYTRRHFQPRYVYIFSHSHQGTPDAWSIDPDNERVPTTHARRCKSRYANPPLRIILPVASRVYIYEQ